MRCRIHSRNPKALAHENANDRSSAIAAYNTGYHGMGVDCFPILDGYSVAVDIEEVAGIKLVSATNHHPESRESMRS